MLAGPGQAHVNSRAPRGRDKRKGWRIQVGNRIVQRRNMLREDLLLAAFLLH